MRSFRNFSRYMSPKFLQRLNPTCASHEVSYKNVGIILPNNIKQKPASATSLCRVSTIEVRPGLLSQRSHLFICSLPLRVSGLHFKLEYRCFTFLPCHPPMPPILASNRIEKIRALFSRSALNIISQDSCGIITLPNNRYSQAG
jgi:hypothetical protein